MVSPVLVTGGSGQLAGALADAGPAAGIPIRRAGRPDFDFDRPESIAKIFAAAAPRAVVNAAAYTAVDAAESDPEGAMRANRDGPATLARLCAQAAIPFVHVSTDYVFDGRKGTPYMETDPTSPEGVYGATKLAGEEAVLSAYPNVVILRTSWVYAATGKNFVRTMLNAARKTHTLRVVADQKGCPTAAADLADAILGVLAQLLGRNPPSDTAGIYHAAGTGWTTWHGLAVALFEAASRHDLTPPEVRAITTAEWPTPAKRPADSRLDCTKLADRFGVRLPPWREGLNRTVDAIFSASAMVPGSTAAE